MRPILHRTCWSLKAAFAGRRPKSHPEDPCLQIPRQHTKLKQCLSRKFAVAEFKGDWEWHQRLWQMRTHWKSKQICHACRATLNSKGNDGQCCFVLFGSDIPRRSFEECLLVSMPDAPCPLVLVDGFHPGIIRFCAMHVLALGIYQTLCAEALLWLCESQVFSPMTDGMDARLRSAYIHFKGWLRINKLSCSGRQFSCRLLHLVETDFPYLGYKAFNCRIVLAWFLMSEVQNDLETSGRYLTASESENLYSRGQLALRFYREAAEIFSARAQLRFQLRPKLHAMDELLRGCLCEKYNPRYFQNYSEEDVLGLLKPLAQKSVVSSARSFEVSMMKRYFLRCDLGRKKINIHICIYACIYIVLINSIPWPGFLPIDPKMSNEAFGGRVAARSLLFTFWNHLVVLSLLYLGFGYRL
ncbi:unnamed protein product [Symbiodinium sp. CCMP2456]|nr:unnamed protein product [Symbiodinium sp. CCMP2456]